MQIFPKPSGPFSVGTILKHCIDKKRQNPFSTDKNTARELLLQIWYPAEQTKSGQITYYAHDIMSEWIEGLKQSGFPHASIEELKKQTTYAIINAPLYSEKKPYPLLLFCHGYVALRTAYTAYCENLASHGYIVVAIAHTYYTKIIKFPDGKIITALPEHISQQKLTDELKSQKEQQLWMDDVTFVLDTLEILNNNATPDNIFYHAFDLAKLGIFGHSFGGSTAIQMLRTDARIKAAVNLDGGLFGDHALEPLEKPALFLVGQKSFEQYQDYDDKSIAQETGFAEKLISVLRKKYFEYIPTLVKASPCTFFLMIKNAKHAAFSDWALLKQLPLYQENKHIFDLEQETGTIDGVLVTNLINEYLLNFFEHFLKNKPTSLFDRQSCNKQIGV